MKVKSYFAATIEAAMSLARKEMGEDALLLASRQSAPESRHLGACEVVFGLAPPSIPTPSVENRRDNSGAAGPAGAIAGGAPANLRTAADAPVGRLLKDVAELRRELERMGAVIARSTTVAYPAAGAYGGVADVTLSSPQFARLFSSLLACEFPPALAQELIQRVAARLSRRESGVSGEADDPRRITAILRDELGRYARASPELGRGTSSERRVVALVGPPGAGKTTALVKLAVRYGLQTRRPTQIFSMDSHRVAANEALRAYAAILGVGFQALETARALAQALEEHRQKSLILIDTPGLGPKEMDVAQDLARFLATHPEIDTHLVLSASTKSADLSTAADRYGIFSPGRLIFTRLDETDGYGAILSEAVRCGKPISFFSTGQQIPEDFEAATTARIVELVLSRLWIQGFSTQSLSSQSVLNKDNWINESLSKTDTGDAPSDSFWNVGSATKRNSRAIGAA